MARATWVFTVDWLTYRRRAMSSLDSPAATKPTTSRSRAVSSSRARASCGERAPGRELGDQPAGDAR